MSPLPDLSGPVKAGRFGKACTAAQKRLRPPSGGRGGSQRRLCTPHRSLGIQPLQISLPAGQGRNVGVPDYIPRMASVTRSIERRMGDRARAKLPLALTKFVLFVLKQGWARLFGGLFLAAIIPTKLVWQPDWPVHRYDVLFVFAIATQAIFLWAKLET